MVGIENVIEKDAFTGVNNVPNLGGHKSPILGFTFDEAGKNLLLHQNKEFSGSSRDKSLDEDHLSNSATFKGASVQNYVDYVSDSLEQSDNAVNQQIVDGLQGATVLESSAETPFQSGDPDPAVIKDMKLVSRFWGDRTELEESEQDAANPKEVPCPDKYLASEAAKSDFTPVLSKSQKKKMRKQANAKAGNVVTRSRAGLQSLSK